MPSRFTMLSLKHPTMWSVPDGLPEGVKPKRCDCNGECPGWRGGELVNSFYDDDKENQ